MPAFLTPHKSGAHRTAAVALYRALLSQAKILPFEQEEVGNVQNVIRTRFKQQRHNTSTRQLKVLFTAGYEGIDLLDGAVNGGEAEKGRVRELLGQYKEGRVRSDGRKNEVTAVEVEAPRQERIDMFSRPLPKEKLSGKRHIPVLVNAGHIPMLRFTKPQPDSLSKYLHSRIKQRQRRHDRRHMLEEALKLAREEDRWDGIVGGEAGWSVEVTRALDEVQAALQREREKNAVMAERIQGVVDREREMKASEEEEEEILDEKKSMGHEKKVNEGVEDE